MLQFGSIDWLTNILQHATTVARKASNQRISMRHISSMCIKCEVVSQSAHPVTLLELLRQVLVGPHEGADGHSRQRRHCADRQQRPRWRLHALHM